LLDVAELTDDDTEVVVLVVADPPSCKACSFLKYASRNDEVVIDLAGVADVADVAGVGVADAADVADVCAALVAAVGGVGNLRFCRSIASLL